MKSVGSDNPVHIHVSAAQLAVLLVVSRYEIAPGVSLPLHQLLAALWRVESASFEERLTVMRVSDLGVI